MSNIQEETPYQAESEKDISQYEDFYRQLDKVRFNATWSDNIHGLRLTSWNSNASVTLLIAKIKVMFPNGDIQESVYLHVPNTDRSAKTTIINEGIGWIIGIAIFASGTAPRRGQCFIKIEEWDINKGEQVNALFADYLDGNQFLSYPTGRIISSIEGPGILRSVLGTDPAAGVEVTDAVPTGARWKLKGVRVTFVTSAAIANRRVNLQITDGTNVLFEIDANQTQAASITSTYDGLPGYAVSAGILADEDFFIPLDLMMLQGWQIKTNTTLLDVGDNYGPPRYTIEEWIEP